MTLLLNEVAWAFELMTGLPRVVISVAPSPAGGLFATGSGDMRARIWRSVPKHGSFSELALINVTLLDIRLGMDDDRAAGSLEGGFLVRLHLWGRKGSGVWRNNVDSGMKTSLLIVPRLGLENTLAYLSNGLYGNCPDHDGSIASFVLVDQRFYIAQTEIQLPSPSL